MELLTDKYFAELLTVLTIAMLAIISPGPDFFIVVRNSLSCSRRSGLFTTLGVATAIWIHIFYTLAGIGLIISQSIILFSIIKYLGAVYLIFLGWTCVRNKRTDKPQYRESNRNEIISDIKSFKMGFITNALNPKATLFFMSLFTQIVSVDTPLLIQVTYGAIVSLSCLIWFSLVAVFLNHKEVRRGFDSIQFYFEKIMGTALIALGLKVAFTSR